MPQARYAVYLAPPREHPLWQAGCAWLGRDAGLPPPYAPPRVPEVAEPWRYGFHATLKAPLRLHGETTEAAFLAGVRAVAARHRAFVMPALSPGRLTDFLALRHEGAVDASHPLRRLADDTVLSLDRFRAPLTLAERARQLKPGLSPRQQAQVDCLGYAFVLDDWRLHFTLSGPIRPDDSDAWQRLGKAAVQHFATALRSEWSADALCVFLEPEAGQPFELRERMPLSGI